MRTTNQSIAVAITASNRKKKSVTRYEYIHTAKENHQEARKRETSQDRRRKTRWTAHIVQHPNSTDLHGEERSAKHAHGVHVLRELADHHLHVLGDARALVEVGGELVNLPGVARNEWRDSGGQTRSWMKTCTAKTVGVRPLTGTTNTVHIFVLRQSATGLKQPVPPTAVSTPGTMLEGIRDFQSAALS